MRVESQDSSTLIETTPSAGLKLSGCLCSIYDRGIKVRIIAIVSSSGVAAGLFGDKKPKILLRAVKQLPERLLFMNSANTEKASIPPAGRRQEWSNFEEAMDNVSAAIDRYVGHSMKKVRGYMGSLDSLVIAALLKYQNNAQIRGHLCEIGVHHGRLFLMLALARRQGERSLAIDLFEDDAINSGTVHAGRDRALLVNARRFGVGLSDEEIYKTSSLDIKAQDILERTTGGVRFFSVDGCHSYRGVEHDLRLVEQTLTPEGVIAIDDFFSRSWPDVSFATGAFLRHTDKLVPFAITSKLYVSAPAEAEKYQTALHELADVAQISSVEILGKTVLNLRQSMLKRGFDVLQTRLRAALAWNDKWFSHIK